MHLGTMDWGWTVYRKAPNLNFFKGGISAYPVVMGGDTVCPCHGLLGCGLPGPRQGPSTQQVLCKCRWTEPEELLPFSLPRVGKVRPGRSSALPRPARAPSSFTPTPAYLAEVARPPGRSRHSHCSSSANVVGTGSRPGSAQPGRLQGAASLGAVGSGQHEAAGGQRCSPPPPVGPGKDQQCPGWALGPGEIEDPGLSLGFLSGNQ